MSLFKLVTNTYLFVGLFALNFIIVGFFATHTLLPLLTLKQITRKVGLIIAFGLIFSLISTIITNYLNMTASGILIFLSLISIFLGIITYVQHITQRKQREAPEEFSDKKVNIILIVIAALCVISYIGMEVPPFSGFPLWFELCIPFIMLIPGYLIINIVIPYRDELRIMERLGIAIFISLIMTSTIGIILVHIEQYLNMRHVSIVLIVITFIILLPAYYIRIKEVDSSERFSNSAVNYLIVILTIIAVCGVIASGLFIGTGNVDNNTELYQGNTTFTVSGVHENPDEEGYYNFTEGEVINLTMNITNNENKDMDYTLTIEINNDTTDDTIYEKEIQLTNGESKIIQENLTMSNGKKDIRFVLYTNDEPYKIRHLYAKSGYIEEDDIELDDSDTKEDNDTASEN